MLDLKHMNTLFKDIIGLDFADSSIWGEIFPLEIVDTKYTANTK